MDIIEKIHEKHNEWPQAVDLKETDILPTDLFNPELISTAIDLAKKNPRQRAIIRIHNNLFDENHLMVNAILGESYVQPHRHEEREKTETFRIVKGRAFVVFFDGEGNIESKIEINDQPDGRKIATVRSGRWHTVIPMSGETVLLEAKRQPAGGYSLKTDKTMAPWAPDQSESEKGLKYLKDLVASIDKA